MKLFLFFSTLIILSCSKTKIPDNTPACVQLRIDSAMAVPKGSMFLSVASYQYAGKRVFLYTPDCCDRFIEVWNDNCQYLFAPSGGITGCGDCQHTNFYNEAGFITTIWVDPRP